jgi:hypothetical protein
MCKRKGREKMDIDTTIKTLIFLFMLYQIVKVLRPRHDYGQPVEIEIEE